MLCVLMIIIILVCMFRVCMFRMLFCISCELVPEVEAMMIPVEAVLAFFVRLAAGNGMFTNNVASVYSDVTMMCRALARTESE